MFDKSSSKLLQGQELIALGRTTQVGTAGLMLRSAQRPLSLRSGPPVSRQADSDARDLHVGVQFNSADNFLYTKSESQHG